MTIYECPVCGGRVGDNRGARLSVHQWASTWPGLICAAGHRVTRAIKRQRRLYRVRHAAEQAGLDEAAYREQRRVESVNAARWRASSLFVGEADLWAAGVAIGNTREKR